MLALVLALSTVAFAKDHSGEYQAGTYLTSNVASDGTITDNFNCGSATLGSTVCSGGAHANGVVVYQIQVADGIWNLETMRQATDSMQRRVFNSEPVHFKAEKNNPLDLLKNGDKVLFRAESHRKLNGTEHDIFIPFAADPNKEAKFVGWFTPAIVKSQPQPPSDNVKAMCDAHKLSPALEKQLCETSTGAEPVAQPQTALPQAAAQPQAILPQAVQTQTPQPPTGDILTNQSIVEMVRSGMTDDAIEARIQTSKTHFDVSTAATAKLMQDAPGISMDVIKAMVLSWMKR